jgi:hypothetical protein
MTTTGRKTFIFQAKKREGDAGDLRIFVVEGLTDVWVASRCHKIMAPGDLVFFWMAGPIEIRGIYGWGVLISVAERDLQNGGFSVNVRYEGRFGTPLLATTLKMHKRLRFLPVLRNPVGTNFFVSASHAHDLADQIRLNGGEPPDALLARRPFRFDVALSFAGEDRGYARKLEELLRAEGLRVFFDGEQQANLWGQDLKRRLADIYTKDSRYCILLVSVHYKEKRWTQYEWKLLHRRLTEDFRKRRNDPAVLPVRLDDSELEHLPEDCAYLDARLVGLRRVAEYVRKKARRRY